MKQTKLKSLMVVLCVVMFAFWIFQASKGHTEEPQKAVQLFGCSLTARDLSISAGQKENIAKGIWKKKDEENHGSNRDGFRRYTCLHGSGPQHSKAFHRRLLRAMGQRRGSCHYRREMNQPRPIRNRIPRKRETPRRESNPWIAMQREIESSLPESQQAEPENAATAVMRSYGRSIRGIPGKISKPRRKRPELFQGCDSCAETIIAEPNLRKSREGNGSLARGSRTKSIRRGLGKHWQHKPAVIIRGEREICNPAKPEGRAEYKLRTIMLWLRQDGWCCFNEFDFCSGRLRLKEATFHHEEGRCAGKRDDRISIEDEHGKEKFINGAAHLQCNSICGSRRLAINHGSNTTIQIEFERGISA